MAAAYPGFALTRRECLILARMLQDSLGVGASDGGDAPDGGWLLTVAMEPTLLTVVCKALDYIFSNFYSNFWRIFGKL